MVDIMSGKPTAGADEREDRTGQPSQGVAVITGAASGIGKAIAEKMLADGWHVHICDANPQAVEAFNAANPKIGASHADVSDPDQVAALVADVMAKHGRIDILINNAGISGMTAPVETFDQEDWRRTIDININGSFYFVREVVPAMKKAGKGAIINIASTAALFGYPQRTAYATSKWAMLGFTKTLAMELGPQGIRVNAVCPGSVEGPRIDGVIQRDAAQRGRDAADIRRVYESQVSMRKFVRAEDIANMCAFLASDAAAMVSGQIIAVDGHTESLSNPL
ncbi:SDR family oxidoreductase [Henriciella sp. AS95]|uniref:SDR family oxidoreductase n=1 Tax=Henriciella sp. AS95 TaxID=3135782 RepID=UPI00318233E8